MPLERLEALRRLTSVLLQAPLQCLVPADEETPQRNSLISLAALCQALCLLVVPQRAALDLLGASPDRGGLLGLRPRQPAAKGLHLATPIPARECCSWQRQGILSRR